MADATVGTNVTLVSGTPMIGLAGAAITVNQQVYLDQTVSPPTWKPGKCDALATSYIGGIALNTAAVGGQVMVAGPGCTVNMSGATFVVAKTYFGSKTNAGGIAPEADYATGNYPCRIGYAPTATSLFIDPKAYGVAVP